MPPTTSGLRRALSGIFLQKSRTTAVADEEELPQPRSIAQVISVTQNDARPPHLGPPSDMVDAQHPAGSNLLVDDLFSFAQSQLDGSDGNLDDSGSVSNTGASIITLNVCVAAQPELQGLNHDLPTDSRTAQSLCASTPGQEPHAILEQLKADLLHATKENHALQEHVRRQDEEIQILKNRPGNEEQGYHLPSSDFEDRSASFAELKQANDELKGDLHLITTERDRLQENLENMRRELENAASELAEKTTREMDSMEKISRLIKQKDEAEQQLDALKFSLEDKAFGFAIVQTQLTSLLKEQESWKFLMDSTTKRLQGAERENQSLRSGLDAQSTAIAKQRKTEIEMANILQDMFASAKGQDNLDDATGRLEVAKSELAEKSKEFEEISNELHILEDLLETECFKNDKLSARVDDLEFRMKSSAKEKHEAEEQAKTYSDYAEAVYKESQAERTNQRLASEAQVAKLESHLKSNISDLAHAQAQVFFLQGEKKTWEGRMNTIKHKAIASERRLRMLNHASQTQDSDRSNIRRCKNFMDPRVPSTEIIDAVTTLNVAILMAATDIAPLFVPSLPPVWNGKFKRAESIFGEWVSSLLLEKGWNRPSFIQSIIQIFLVDWCRSIIEAWYPKQQSFAELFVAGLSSNDMKGTIRFQAISVASKVGSPNFGSWARHVLDDLLEIIPAQNIRRDDVLPTIVSLVECAYNIRQGLSEEDICGNLQLRVPPSDLQFESESMVWPNNTNLKITKSSPTDLGDIAGCTGIGLEKVLVQKSRDGISSINRTTILPPTVVLARELVV
ncbi:hypothetical protein BDN70DRAFT_937756 [Pholiota conissans]|uniref:Uncharacterized protein n=1 Tax=Pholiota conissans TaxID=109636 RepID=A0A9P5YQV5_9AGAR|nr:hypothetical protein BDN70DRAFT_937756 [Pholiota conissans]